MKKIIAVIVLSLLTFSNSYANGSGPPAISASGVRKFTVNVSTNSNGVTIEQENVGNRLLMDNKIGSIKHLYVISPYSGQVIIYSTIKGKVTSSHKRLTPKTVVTGGAGDYRVQGFKISIGGAEGETSEVLGDDGTYGESDDYIYWWDVRGVYHQHFLTGGQIIHISDQPLVVKSVIINMELK